MVEIHCWETYLVYGWKNKTSKSLLAGKFVLIVLLAEKEQKLFWELFIKGVLLEGEKSYFFTGSLEIELLIFPVILS